MIDGIDGQHLERFGDDFFEHIWGQVYQLPKLMGIGHGSLLWSLFRSQTNWEWSSDPSLTRGEVRNMTNWL